jgi:hypothetical protein
MRTVDLSLFAPGCVGVPVRWLWPAPVLHRAKVNGLPLDYRADHLLQLNVCGNARLRPELAVHTVDAELCER